MTVVWMCLEWLLQHQDSAAFVISLASVGFAAARWFQARKAARAAVRAANAADQSALHGKRSAAAAERAADTAAASLFEQQRATQLLAEGHERGAHPGLDVRCLNAQEFLLENGKRDCIAYQCEIRNEGAPIRSIRFRMIGFTHKKRGDIPAPSVVAKGSPEPFEILHAQYYTRYPSGPFYVEYIDIDDRPRRLAMDISLEPFFKAGGSRNWIKFGRPRPLTDAEVDMFEYRAPWPIPGV